ncbi:MAG: bifunctional (p)ppGpp synthetase/guanosine-3',5'-bis(diphosphate) 3'-pyrophosphohydrolase [Anaerolineae bacterium]|nr:bifunctional (p)ppGpp synthetase/guanosine-3',5'-bis(diphosphate) 3'-pyrophosphohydrolase [Anaerolineae bacterium]
MDLQQLLSSLSNLTPAEVTLIERAYRRAEKAHEGQIRRSGEPYFVHCVAVAHILAELNLDGTTIAAALLHDTVEDTDLTLEDIEREFGADVARLVDGVTKMEHLPTQVSGKDRDREAEFLRKTMLAMNDDVRIVLIKLADRLHNMRTLGYLEPERQIEVAQETMDIFAPLANRLGIWRMKWELEDLAFRYLNPKAYREIATRLDERRADRDKDLQRIIEHLSRKLEEANIKAKVTGRPKHIYSIYRKMQRKDVSYEQVYDIRAVRVLVDDIPTCYQVLGLVHSIWRPIAGQFDDYIAAPKDNFYQSLHTTVHDEQGRSLEVQIRTWEMHRNAEYGIAAHWRYKEGSKRENEAFERHINYLRYLMAFKDEDEEIKDATEFMNTLKSEVFQDRVYAFTPKGDIVDLPAGATPVDFAYYIHTEIGNRCRGAKVNGALVGLDYKLRTGDRVEILTAKRGGPSLDWLSPHMGYTATTRARSKIRQWFRKQNRDNNIAAGRVALDRELKRLGRADMSYDDVAALFKMRTDDLLAAIGHGDINSGQIASRILEAERRIGRETLERELRLLGRTDMSYEQVAALFGFQQAEDLLSAIGYGDITGEQINERIRAHEQLKALEGPDQDVPLDASDGVEIEGSGGGLLINLARCCNPTPGDMIIGYITRGRGITVHRSDCKNVLNTTEPDRLITVNWRRTEQRARAYPVPVMIVAFDREGLMRDIGAVIADEKINMSNVSITTKQNIATFLVTMEIADVDQLTRVLTKIERLPNVVKAHRRTAV